MLISERVKDIFGGVSQAPPAARKSSQWTELVNSLPVFGRRLGRRPPLLHMAQLSASVPATSTFEHGVITSTGRRVHLVVTNGTLSAYDAETGASITVVAPDGTGYLDAASLKAASSGDVTMFLNTQSTVARSPQAAPARKNEALLYVRQGDYSTNYAVTLSGFTFTYTTPDSGVAGALAATATDQIAAAIVALLVANVTIAAQFYVQRYGSTIYVARLDGADFAVSSTDGIADKGLVLIKGSIQRFADLPVRCRAGVIVEVTGDDSTQFDNYYVKYRGNTTTDQRGVWEEVVLPGASTALNGGTMPHRCTFRGRLMESTAHVDTSRLLGVLEAIGLGPSYPTYNLTFPADALYPAGCPLVVAFGGGATFTYTVGGAPESAATVAAGLQALINADPTYAITRLAPEQLRLKRADNGFFTVTSSGGFSNATTFAMTLALPAGLVGSTIGNLTDGSSGVITGVGIGTITVASLSGGVTNLFNDGDLCVAQLAGDYFLFGAAPWATRGVGDDVTVPFPSFVGKTLSEVFFHQGRCGVTSGSGVAMSRAGDVFNFFRSTATAVLSDDPIDIQNALGDASPFHSAIEWNDALYLFSGLKQYILGSADNGAITPTTVRLRAVSAYQSDDRIRPVTAGDRLYFVAIKSGFTRVLEYAIRGVAMRHEALDTGLHCPTYVEGSPIKLCLDETQGMLLLLTDGRNQKSIFVYSYRIVDGETLSSAWGRWDFQCGTLLTLDCIEGRAAVLTKQSDGLFLGTLLLDPQALGAYRRYDGTFLYDGTIFYDGSGDALGAERVAYLDRRISSATPGLTVAFSGGVTTWTLPFNIDATGLEGTVSVCTDAPVPTVYAATRPAPNQVTVVGDHRTEFVYIGVLYTTSQTLSRLFVRSQDDEVDERGRLQLRFLRVHYTDSTDLTVTVAQSGRGSRATALNTTAASSGTLLVPLQGRNDELTITFSNGTPGAGHIVSYDWEGTYHTRERAI